MTSLTVPPAVAVGPNPATVSVHVEVPVGVEEAWHTLVAPEAVRHWWGELSGEVVAGARVRLDFADGDFFDIDVTGLEAPSTLECRWRFLGIGPCCRVRWHLEGRSETTRVEVSDTQAGRSAEESQELGTGWADFLERYRSHLATGADTRYPWREGLDGSIEVPQAPRWLFDAEVRPKWLPLRQATMLDVAGGGPTSAHQPWRLRVDRVVRPRPTRLVVVLGAMDGPPLSICRLELVPTANGGSLGFVHHGWQQLLAETDDRRRARSRLTRTWIDTLVRARALLER